MHVNNMYVCNSSNECCDAVATDIYLNNKLMSLLAKYTYRCLKKNNQHKCWIIIVHYLIAGTPIPPVRLNGCAHCQQICIKIKALSCAPQGEIGKKMSYDWMSMLFIFWYSYRIGKDIESCFFQENCIVEMLPFSHLDIIQISFCKSQRTNTQIYSFISIGYLSG